MPGSDFVDTKNVPHGAWRAVTYYSTALSTFRRMHVYTPPGYERGNDKYPVFYLLHGAGDSDDSWTSVGRAGFILDNLIAAKKAKPMIVVMPAGHTRRGAAAAGRNRTDGDRRVRQGLRHRRHAVRREELPRADRPEQHGDRGPLDGRQPHAPGRHPAPQSLRLHRRLQLGPARRVSGTRRRPPRSGAASRTSAAALRSSAAPPPLHRPRHRRRRPRTGKRTTPRRSTTPALKKGLKLFWFATGKDDGLLTTTNATVELFKKHGFNPVMKEASGGHTWINWRDYLNEFAPMLFQ